MSAKETKLDPNSLTAILNRYNEIIDKVPKSNKALTDWKKKTDKLRLDYNKARGSYVFILLQKENRDEWQRFLQAKKELKTNKKSAI